MANEIIERYPYEKRSWYPHMMPEDIAVWERFISLFPESYQTCMYDFPVGRVPDFVLNDPNVDQASMERLYKKKIDVIGERDGTLDLIELKPLCTMSTIGQIKGYLHLYRRDFAPPAYVQAIVICGGASPDVVEYAREEGVLVIIV